MIWSTLANVSRGAEYDRRFSRRDVGALESHSSLAFPWLREEVQPMTEQLGRLITILDVIGLGSFVPEPPRGPERARRLRTAVDRTAGTGGEAYFAPRNGMTGMAGTPVLPEATLVGAVTAQLRRPRRRSATPALRRCTKSLRSSRCAGA